MPPWIRFSILWTACILFVPACTTISPKSEKPELTADQMRQMGENYLAAGDTGLALQYLTKAEEKQPNEPVIQYDLGMAYWARGLPNEAIPRFEKALTLKPDYAESSNALGVLYAQKGEYSKAEAAFQKALANPFYQTPFFALYNMGLIDEKRGNPKAALAKYEQAIRMQQAYAPPYLRIGIIQEQNGNYAGALESFNKAIQYNPNMAEALLHIGILKYKTSDFAGAQEALSQVVRISPDSDFAQEAKKYLETMSGGSQLRTQ